MPSTKRTTPAHHRPYTVSLTKKAQLAIDALSEAQRSRVLLVINGLSHWKAVAGAVKSSIQNHEGPLLFVTKVGLLRILFHLGEHHTVKVTDVMRASDSKRSR